MADTDHADAEVRGISRYIPTTLSKAILVILPGAAWLAFSSIREHPSWFLLESLTSLEQTLLAALVSAFLCGVLILVLILDMAVAVHHSKHRRIVHYSNAHPLMSFKFIIQNAGIMHWLFIGAYGASVFIAGYMYAQI